MDFIYICGADMLYMFKILELLCLYQEFSIKFGITFEISHLWPMRLVLSFFYSKGVVLRNVIG